ncbi:PRC-barrel domain-containing protein [Sphingoaurantiacus capsulatus]|uniref:PRC-barrel domain-containing protein n=1 Tax=Sphingoaurantiacus capsulatus TaxID=1771310 RepID=A0ABV7XE60_9SPHN
MNENKNSGAGFEGRGAAPQRDDTSLTRSQTGFDTQGRSADYDDDRLGDDKLLDGRHATDLNPDGTLPGTAPKADDRREPGDNRDGLGRDQSGRLAADETGKLIASDKVVDTAVYNSGGEKLGSIHSVMLHKISGRVAYAVMSFGGFLGIGERYHPLPWDALTYDEAKGGYNIGHTVDQLRAAPHYSREELDALDYGKAGPAIYDYYGVSFVTPMRY